MPVIARRLRDERGITIVEALIACVLTLLVTGTGLSVLEGAYRHNDQVQRRTEAMQQVRSAMDQAVTALRSQVCLGGTSPIVAADDKSVTFYADYGDGHATSVPDKHVLAFDPATGRLTDARYTGSPGSPPTYTTPAASRVLGTHLAPSGSTPMLRYYGYDTAVDPPTATKALDPAGVPGDASKVARIVVTLQANPPGKVTGTHLTTTLGDQVFVRLADPTTGVIQCA